jgi:hypothetical protein
MCTIAVGTGDPRAKLLPSRNEDAQRAAKTIAKWSDREGTGILILGNKVEDSQTKMNFCQLDGDGCLVSGHFAMSEVVSFCNVMLSGPACNPFVASTNLSCKRQNN